MPRKKATSEAALPARPPHVITPTAVYTVAEARAALHLKHSTIRREVREGRLRVAKRAGRYYLLGRWLLEWIEQGEIVRSKPAGTRPLHAGANGGAN
jgi:hypothetical protein